MYQITPDVIIAPKDVEDLQRVMQVIDKPSFRSVPNTPRGCGTGANGQSLNHGAPIDSRCYIHRALSFDASIDRIFAASVAEP
jgi:FAD/FMN-containing dehydrogenase